MLSPGESPPARRPSRARRLVFRALAVLTGLLAVPLGAEAVLWLAGRGYPARFLIARDGMLTDNYRFAWRYFPRAIARAQQPIRIDRDRGRTFRIVVYGESAAMGDPEPAVGLPRMLEAILERRHPDVTFEVVNAAMTAISSHVIADIAADMASVPADVSVVYIGNNEVVGPFGPGTVFGAQAPPHWQVRLVSWSRRTRLGQWIQSLGERRQSAPETWRGMEMFVDSQIPPDDPRLNRMVDSFRSSLRSILRSAGASGRPVILSAAAVNLRDFPPFGSTGEPAPDDARLEDLRAAVEADPRNAVNTWRLARALLESGDAAAAQPLFRRARDLDTLRFRCDSVLQRVVSEVAGESSGPLTLVDAQAHLDSLDPGGVAGAAFFHEHVHLTPRGSWEVARLIADAVAKHVPAGRQGTDPSLEACLARLAFTPWHEYELEREMLTRMSRAPYTGQYGHAARDAALAERIRELAQAVTPETGEQWCAAVLEVCRSHPDDWRCRQMAARLLEFSGRPEALDLLAEAAALMPHQSVLQQQGAALNRFRKYAEAETVLRKALGLRPDFAQAWNSLGIALSHLERVSEAADAFRSAADLVPDYHEARRNLASMLVLQRDFAGAEAQLRRAIESGADDAATHSQLGSVLTASGRTADAVPHYLRAAALLPRDPAAQINAGAALLRSGRRDEALPYLRAAAKLAPDSADAARLLREAEAAGQP